MAKSIRSTDTVVARRLVAAALFAVAGAACADPAPDASAMTGAFDADKAERTWMPTTVVGAVKRGDEAPQEAADANAAPDMPVIVEDSDTP